MKVGQREYAPRNPLVFRRHSTKQDGASLTGTEELSTAYFNQVGMVGGNFCATKLTTHSVLLAPDELAEGPECVLKSRLDCVHYWLTIRSRSDFLNVPRCARATQNSKTSMLSRWLLKWPRFHLPVCSRAQNPMSHLVLPVLQSPNDSRRARTHIMHPRPLL